MKNKLSPQFFQIIFVDFKLTPHNLDLYAKSMTEFWDRLGISASLICAIHCILTPFLVLLVPFIGSVFADKWFHIGIAAVVFPVAAFALWRGYRHHRLLKVLALGAVGLVFMAMGMYMGDSDFTSAYGTIQTLFMIAAGLLLASAHYFNLRACRRH
jgi:hypothetical protein